MRTLVLAIVLVALANATRAQPPDQSPSTTKTDQELFVGVWSIVGLETGGRPEPDKNYKGNTFTFTKDKAVLRERGFQNIDFNYSIDSTKSPKTIDLKMKGGALKGIYKIDGDDLVMCVSIGGSRPADFATKAGVPAETFTLRRSRWERHTNKSFGFSVEMPGHIEEWTRNIDGVGGPALTTFFVAPHDDEKSMYMLAVTPLPGKLEGKDAEDALQTARKSLIAEVAGMVKVMANPDRDFKANGIDGKELSMTTEIPNSQESGNIRVRLFIVGDQMFGLMVAGPEEIGRSRNVDRFWGSFRKLGAEKSPRPRD